MALSFNFVAKVKISTPVQPGTLVVAPLVVQHMTKIVIVEVPVHADNEW